MRKLLVLTDLHITNGTPIIGLDPMNRLRRTLDAACGAHPDAEALILLGDLTHHGDTQSYTRLKAALADVPLPVVPLVGNHDRRDAFLSVFTDAPQTGSGHVQTSWDLPHHRIITLDTLDGPPYPERHHAGYLCNSRLAWLDRQLDDLGDRMALVFAHHPPFVTGLPGMDAIRLANGPDLLQRLAQRRAHLFCGHIHRTISGTTDGVPWSIFKSPCHQAPLDLVTPDSSLSIDEPAGYGLILLPQGGVITHYQDVMDDIAVAHDAAATGV